MYTNRVFGTAICVLFIEVSSFQSALIKGVPLYMCMYIHVLPPPMIMIIDVHVHVHCTNVSRNSILHIH